MDEKCDRGPTFMSKKIVNILCEGQSEQQFALKVLRPYFLSCDIVIKATLLTTNRKLNAQGGIINYAQVERDLNHLIRSCHDTEYETHYFSTMFDLYALPSDFPGINNGNVNPYTYVEVIEVALGKCFHSHRFVPYIELHEFEALVLCNLPKLKEEYILASERIDALDTQWRKDYENPELVNSSVETAPSKRIIKALKGLYNYNKPRMAVEATKAMGIDELRKQCPHFDEWLSKIESL